ncbi:hypothetical protein Pmani_029609 [Petrolisthes manimaculis]|uniref:Secreted protein n=1 Tax=Petrolisthes manimaculis TaxID=1843537 RepID=A0AAE1NZ75_9EUCA|nr:hypothetical protein Pmani_029609 [Petrolisthes manimaculis]
MQSVRVVMVCVVVVLVCLNQLHPVDAGRNPFYRLIVQGGKDATRPSAGVLSSEPIPGSSGTRPLIRFGVWSRPITI